MGDKSKWIIVAVLAVVTFAASYLLSGMFAGDESDAPEVDPASDEPGTPGVTPAAAGVEIGPKGEEVTRLMGELRTRLAECKRREEELDRREERIKLAREALTAQAEQLEALRMELVGPLTRLKDARDALESTRLRITAAEKDNLKKTAAIYEKMDSAEGSRILGEMCAGGQESDAVRILRFMSERSAAKVLEEFEDKTLAARLCNQMKRIEEES